MDPKNADNWYARVYLRMQPDHKVSTKKGRETTTYGGKPAGGEWSSTRFQKSSGVKGRLKK